MTALQAIALAVVQGITEFFPISSSAHLILMPRLMRWQDQGLPFDIATHCGTLLAILIYFRADLVRVGRGWIASWGAPAPGDAETGRLGWALLLGTVPAAIAGLALRDLIATEARNPLLIACTSIGYGLLMGWADRGGSRRRALESVGLQDGLIIGLAQALALVPGTSRSGITITAALLLGFQRPAAARFSFLLAVPVSLLVAADDALQFWMGRISASELVPMALGLLVSALVGYLVIAALLGWLRRRSLLVFTLYRVGLGLAIFTTLWLGG